MGRRYLLESAVQANVNHDINLLKSKPKFVYERVPFERIEQYQTWRETDRQREQYLVNRRFPELDKAREAYLGKEPERTGRKNLHAQEIIKFSDVVYNLAQEEEPHPARSSFYSTQKKVPKSQQRWTKGDEMMKKSTLAHSVKDVYIVRSRHTQIGASKFLPTNRQEARSTVHQRTVYQTENYLDTSVAFSRNRLHD